MRRTHYTKPIVPNEPAESATIIPPKWAFVDNENYPGFFRGRDLSQYERIYLFIGSNQKSLNIELVSQLLSVSQKVRFVLIEMGGRNNLDMHLIFYLGSAHQEADDDVEFVIFSSDNDFDNIILHCQNRLNRKCYRIMDETNYTYSPKAKIIHPTVLPTLNIQSTSVPSTDIPYDKVVENLVKVALTNPSSLPQRKSSLVNFISSIIKPYANGRKPDDFIQQLVSDKKIKINNYNRITYTLNTAPPQTPTLTDYHLYIPYPLHPIEFVFEN
jgi:hypothetical protein